MLKLIRLILGSLIAFFNWLTRGRKLNRSAEQQALVEQALKSYALYQFTLCPFCIKVRRTLHQLNLPMELRDAKNNQQFRQELKEQGGKIKVPCLRIDHGDKVEWMYESDDINHFLKEKFSKG
jgi:glutaredoxin